MTPAASSPSSQAPTTFDVQRVRRDFPILNQKIHGKPLVYLDNAATTQKPQAVIDAMVRSYAEDNANIHRGVHLLSERATQAYELAREKVQHFLNAAQSREIIFVRGTTEAINLVAATYGRRHVGEGDEVLITEMEHHSNIIPWQMLCEEKGAHLKVLPITDEGELRMDLLDGFLTDRTKIVAVNHVSNSLGTINPIAAIVEKAHQRGIPVLVDGAQAVAHMPVDVQALGADFYAFSGHKLFGPTGVGVLYGKLPLLEAMPPYQGGGDMISSVTFKKTTYNVVPNKFEAGTPNIAGAVGLGAAIDYVRTLDAASVSAYEADLLAYGTKALSALPGIRLIGTARHKASVLSFVMENVHPHDIGTILDQEGVAIRTGHHCTQPLMERMCVPATARASLALYNTREEIDALIRALDKVREIFD
jgi:cysteine desulfurase/selenocysteine lyase